MKKIVDLIQQSLRGETYDYTQGSIPKAVILLAIPMMLELCLESVFALVDIYFVAKLGSGAIVTVGLTESAITILYSLAIGLSTGATALVARRIGEKNPEAAAHAGAQSIIIAFVCSLVITIFGVIYSKELLHMMGASPEVVEQGYVFTRIMMGGSISIIFIFLINGIFRGAGDAAVAMHSLWIASGINIILCPILIHFYGLKGAAIATVIGRTSGVVYQCYHLFSAKGTIIFTKKLFKVNRPIIESIVQIAWPATFQFIIASGSWIIIARLVALTGGTDASAGYQIAIRNVVFFILPAWGLSNAAATLVGQNLGAQQPARAEQSVLIATKYNIIFMSFVMALFMFLPKTIIGFFTDNVTVTVYGAQALQIIGSAYIFYGISMVMTQAMNGAGDTSTPTWIYGIGFWLFQIPLAYLLAYYFKLNTIGAVIAIPIAETFIAVIAYYYFKKGKWKEIKV